LTRIGGGAVETVPTNAIPAAEAVAEPTVVPNSPPSDLTEFDAGLSLGKPLVLEDLVFGSGSAELQKGDYASLRGLADWLKNNPDKTVILVGHTDASGGLSANVALSKKRAQSVRQTLLANFNIPGAQIAADGVGPLAPRESNLSQEGRQKNRRVEVLTTPTP
jgi:OOP family OmpA-OmpF porin